MKQPASPCTAFRGLPWLARANAIGVVGAVAAFSAVLWPQWLHDENLSHGIFLPVLACILVVESRRDCAPRFARSGAGALAACALLALASLGSLTVAVVYSEAVGWSHAVTEFMLSVGLSLALGAAWLAFADRRVRFVPLNWPAGVAVTLWLFAGPPPPGTYARFALLLQGVVTGGVVRIFSALGLAAYQNGNVIELARTSVGVSEACSGVRSLISCTVAGLFLSALLVSRPWRRALVVVVSPAIGLAMNFLRSLLLTLLANAGVNIEGRWHDLTGASILVATTLIVAAFAFFLRRGEGPAGTGRGYEGGAQPGRSPLQVVMMATLVMAAVPMGILTVRNRPAAASEGAVPDLESLLPSAPAGWTAQVPSDLDQYSGVLQTHTLVERVYSAGPTLESPHLTLYLAYWRPGQAPVSLVDAHTPDTCWPGSGWAAEAVPSERAVLSIGGRVLSPAECRLFALNRYETHVWYWHLHGGRPITYVDPYSAIRLLGLAWRYGFSRPQDQLFVRVSSNRPWQEIASEPTLQHFFENLKPFGL